MTGSAVIQMDGLNVRCQVGGPKKVGRGQAYHRCIARLLRGCDDLDPQFQAVGQWTAGLALR